MIFSKEVFMVGFNAVRKSAIDHLPDILMGAGIISITAGAVYACLKSEEAVDALDELETEKLYLEQKKGLLEKDYPKKQQYKDEIIFYAGAVKKVIKIYAIPAGFFIGGIGMICASHAVLKNRNAALIAAYNTLDASYKAYKERVKEVFGEDAESKIKSFIQDEVDELEDDSEEEKTKKIKAKRKTELLYSPYAKFFDEYSEYWDKNPQKNIDFIRGQQRIANIILETRGYIFLNEVYRSLGIPETKEGQVVGWVQGNGDNYIDFGIYNGYSEAARDFVNKREPSILLDFNVDGVILDVFERKAASKW